VLKIFEKRLLLKLQNHVNIIYIDSKKFTKGNIEKEILQASVNEKIGEKYPKEIYSLCLTNDQIKVIKAFEWFVEKNYASMVIKANRGRGKSLF
jgi:tRNA(Met) C34 N-acetyltransferase TmcA